MKARADGALVAASATVAVCTQPANTGTQPCSPLATLYTDSTLATPCTGVLKDGSIAGATNCSNPLVTDAKGNYHFYSATGPYTIQVYGSGLVASFEPDVPVGNGGAVTTQVFNGTLYVGTGGYATCQAAITAAGSVNRTIIEILPTYTGAACPNTITPNIILRNYMLFGGTGVNTQLYCNPASGFLNTCQAINYGGNDGNVNGVERHETIFNTVPGGNGAVLGFYALSHIQNATFAGGQTVDGTSSEANTWGALSGTLAILSGVESDTTIHSTGGTITNAYGTQGYVNTAAASTTAITNATGLKGIGCNSILGVVPTNCYGGYFTDQAAKGATRNYSLVSEGKMLVMFSATGNLADIDMEDNTHAVHNVLFVDNSNKVNIAPVAATGIDLLDNTATRRATVDGLGILVGGQLRPDVAGARTVGTAALPFLNLIIGTAATNNFTFTPAATAAARTVNIPDPLQTTTTLPLVIANGTKALNTASITTATCDAGLTATATGTLSTDAVDWSFNAAPSASNKYGAFLVVYAVPSANTVTFYTCNPSATTSTPTAMTVNWSVRRP